VSIAILRGDARNLPLADRSVDLVVTSPPYWALRSYTDGGEHYAGQIGSEPTPAAYIDTLIECTAEWMRVLKPGGSIWVNLGDKYSSDTRGPNGESSGLTNGAQHRVAAAARPAGVRPRGTAAAGVPKKSLLLLPERYRIACVDRLGLIARAVVIWSKPNGLPESVTDRVRRSHEDWVHLVKQQRYFADVDAIRESPANPGKNYGLNGAGATALRSRNTSHAALEGVDDSGRYNGPNPLGKLPGSVREVATQPLKVPDHLGVDHFAAFPMDWPRWIISGWSPAGGTVLDPFGGTGTTALVADVLGRHGISVDRSADYCRLAAWRTTDPGQRAAAMGVEKPAAQAEGQIDLFDLAGAP
jgi:DNA modification methylase